MEGVTAYLLTQGALGIACIALGGVVIYLQRKIDRLYLRIDELMSLRLQENKDVSNRVMEVMSETSQTTRVLTEKIEAGKGRR